jgi:hypothetical protein
MHITVTCGMFSSKHSSTSPHKCHDFKGGGGEVLNIKCVFSFSQQLRNIYHSRRMEIEMIINVFWYAYKVPVIIVRF